MDTKVQIPEDLNRAVISALDWTDFEDWIPWAWGLLVRAGDVPIEIDDDDLDYAFYAVTLAALAHLFDLFQDVSHGLKAEDSGPGADLTGDERPYITDIEIARYCERHGYYEEYFPESGSELFTIAVKAQTAQMKARLLGLLGEARLYTSLSVAGEGPEPQVDDEDEEDSSADRPDPEPAGHQNRDDAFDLAIDSVMNWNLAPDEHRAYAWLTEGA